MSSTTFTGQFHAANMGYENNVGCPVAWGSTLYYFTSDSNSTVKVVSCDVSTLQSGSFSTITQDSAWSSLHLSDKISSSNKNGANFVTNYGTAAVALGTRLYYFWVDTNNSGQIYMAYQDNLGNFSTYAYKLYEDNSSNPLEVGCNLSANVAPNGTTIALNWFKTSSLKLHTLTLDPTDIDDTNKRWIGADSSSTPTVNGYSGMSSVDASYYRISSAWFTQGNQGNFMVASFYSSDDNHVYFLLYPINDDGTPAHTSSSYVFPITDFDCKRGFYITRDPAGRLYGVFCKDDSSYNLYYTTFNTFQTVQQVSGVNPSLSWNTATLLNGQSNDSEKGPAVAFIAGNSSAGTIQLPTPSNPHQIFDCTNVPQYSVVMYAAGSSNEMKAQIAPYGTSVIVPNYSTLTPSTTYQSSRILSILMDSFPLPNQNLGTTVSANREVIEYAYGASSTTELSATMSVDLKFGIKSSVSTTKGVGPAAEDVFKTGPQASISASTQNTTFHSLTVDTTPISASPGASTQYVVDPLGAYHGSTPWEIIENSAIFVDTGNNIVNGSQAPLFSSLQIAKASSTSDISGDYSAYCYTPGDIYSYQKENIDSKMAGLYNNLSSSVRNSHFTPGYASGYIENVIIPNAVQLGNDNYLEFSFSGSGHSATTMQQINKVVATLGWTVQGSSYVGGGGGEELSILGFGEAINTSLMVGFEYNFSVSGGVTESSTWGVSFNSSVPNNVSGALGYTVRMYLCAPNNMWARELQYFGTDATSYSNIDFDNSAPMKIMFVVSQIV